MDELPPLPAHFDGESIYSSAEMRAYAAAAVAQERERIMAPIAAHEADLRKCVEPLRQAGMHDTANEVLKAADELAALFRDTTKDKP